MSSAFLASLGSCAPLARARVALGVAGWLVLLAVGVAITWVSRVLQASLALWTPSVALDVVYGALWQFGRYPVSVYRQPLRNNRFKHLDIADARVLVGYQPQDDGLS